MNSTTPPLLSARLLLRRWREDDADALYRYACDPAVGLAAGWPPHASVEESREVIRTVFSAAEVYAVVERRSGEPIGCVGLLFDGSGHLPLQADEAELGYWLGRPHWGRGLTTEAARRLLAHCFDDLNLQVVRCGHYDGNERSRRVMEKCGFGHHRTIIDTEGCLQHFLSLSRDEWHAQAHDHSRLDRHI